MQKLKNWLISKWLKKDKLVAVPESWQVDYVKLAGDKVQNSAAMVQLMNAYNDLLRDYYEKCSAKDLLTFCKESNINVKSNTSKEIMVDLLYKEFRMVYEKN